MAVTLSDEEIILSGQKYLSCQHCNDRQRLDESCETCGGWGYVINPDYVSAARGLGLPEPPVAGKEASEELRAIMRRMKNTGVRVEEHALRRLTKFWEERVKT